MGVSRRGEPLILQGLADFLCPKVNRSRVCEVPIGSDTGSRDDSGLNKLRWGRGTRSFASASLTRTARGVPGRPANGRRQPPGAHASGHRLAHASRPPLPWGHDAVGRGPGNDRSEPQEHRWPGARQGQPRPLLGARFALETVNGYVRKLAKSRTGKINQKSNPPCRFTGLAQRGPPLPLKGHVNGERPCAGQPRHKSSRLA